MNTKLLILAASAFAAATAPVQAAEREGSVQIKAFVTGVLPDGKIKTVEVDAVGLPANT